MNSTKIRLSILSFLQFAVWGSYLVCLGQYLGPAGLGSDIAWFYSVVGFVSIFHHSTFQQCVVFDTQKQRR